jgi:hypothetical protein
MLQAWIVSPRESLYFAAEATPCNLAALHRHVRRMQRHLRGRLHLSLNPGGPDLGRGRRDLGVPATTRVRGRQRDALGRDRVERSARPPDAGPAHRLAGRARTSMGIVRARRQPLPRSRARRVRHDRRRAVADHPDDTGASARPSAGRRRRGERIATPPQRGTGRRAAGRAQRTRTDQIVAVETRRTSLHLRLLWALADAFEVPFSVLLSGAPCATTSFRAPRRRCPSSTPPAAVFGRVLVRRRRSSRAGSVRGHAGAGLAGRRRRRTPSTRSSIVVVRGMLTLRAGASTAVLAPGDAVFFVPTARTRIRIPALIRRYCTLR